MPIDVTDLRTTIVPKSDQLNAEQLLGGPMTVTVTDVRVGSGDEQPVEIHYEGENGRPYKPCKTMRKVLIFAWGADGREWVGKSMTLYCDVNVKFGGEAVGGIRISHLSDIPKRMNVSLTATRGKKALYEIEPLKVARGPALADVLTAIADAHNKASMEAAKALATKLRDPDDVAAAQEAYRARVAAIKAAASAQQNTQGGAVSNAPSPKGDAKPESVAADSTSSDSGGGAPAADAPASQARNAPHVTAQQIERQMRGAKSMDALNDAASLITALPVPEQKPLNELYKERAAALGVD